MQTDASGVSFREHRGVSNAVARLCRVLLPVGPPAIYQRPRRSGPLGPGKVTSPCQEEHLVVTYNRHGRLMKLIEILRAWPRVMFRCTTRGSLPWRTRLAASGEDGLKDGGPSAHSTPQQQVPGWRVEWWKMGSTNAAYVCAFACERAWAGPASNANI